MRKFPKTFSDISTMEYLWPKKGDRLFRSSGDPETTATFTPHPWSRDAFIWDGFMTAGAALIDEAQLRPHSRNILLYPILFNYRHGLETAMKWTIENYGRLGNVELDERDHDLLALWRKCRKILESARGSSPEARKAVEQIVKDFHDVDKNAASFRYSRNQNGITIHLPDKPIDLQNVQNVMEAVDNFFKASDGLLGDITFA
jgi:hypothetical protein